MADRKIGKEVVRDRRGGTSSGGQRPAPAGNGKRPHSLRYNTQRPDVDVTQEYLFSLRLLESDRELVKYLGEVGYATTEQVSRMYYAKHKDTLASARQRLTQLWEWHVFDRTPCNGLEKYGIAQQLVYLLGKAGNLMLDEAEDEGDKRRKPHGTALMPHDLLLGELLIGLSAVGRKTGWGYVFYGERGALVQFGHNEKRIKLRPDGLLFMNHNAVGLEIPLFVEMDTSMRETDHFRGKAAQYNAYWASKVWTDHFEKFPHVAVVVCGNALDDAAKRQRLADARIQRIIAKVKGEGKWTLGYNWLFARLDQAKLGHFSMLTAKSPELVEFDLFYLDQAKLDHFNMLMAKPLELMELELFGAG